MPGGTRAQRVFDRNVSVALVQGRGAGETEIAGRRERRAPGLPLLYLLAE